MTADKLREWVAERRRVTASDEIGMLRDMDAGKNSEKYADIVEVFLKAIEESLWVDECRCDVAYTSRGRHEPNTRCGELDPLRDAISKAAAIVGDEK